MLMYNFKARNRTTGKVVDVEFHQSLSLLRTYNTAYGFIIDGEKYNLKSFNEEYEETDDSSGLFTTRLIVDQLDSLANIGKSKTYTLEIKKAYIDLLVLFFKSNLYRLSNKVDTCNQNRPPDGYGFGYNEAIKEERRFYQEVASKLQELLEYNPESFNKDPGDDRQIEMWNKER